MQTCTIITVVHEYSQLWLCTFVDAQWPMLDQMKKTQKNSRADTNLRFCCCYEFTEMLLLGAAIVLR